VSLTRLTLAVILLAAFGGGVFAGLMISLIASPEVALMRAEVDRVKTALAASQKTVQEQSAQIKEADQLQRQFFGWNLKSQAFIGALAAVPSAREFFLGSDFLRRYKSEWFAPMECFELLGAKWLVDDMILQGLVTEDAIERGIEQKKTTVTWKPIRTWKVNGIQTTEPFSVQAAIWRIRWKPVLPDGFVMVFAKVAGSDRAAGIASGEGPGFSYMHTGPGHYYLDIHSTTGWAEVTAEQSR